MWWFAATLRTGGDEGPTTFISCTAPCSKVLTYKQNSLPRSWHTQVLKLRVQSHVAELGLCAASHVMSTGFCLTFVSNVQSLPVVARAAISRTDMGVTPTRAFRHVDARLRGDTASQVIE
jgi:hypothetical protein